MYDLKHNIYWQFWYTSMLHEVDAKCMWKAWMIFIYMVGRIAHAENSWLREQSLKWMIVQHPPFLANLE